MEGPFAFYGPQTKPWILAHVAQLVEHIHGKDGVGGSNPPEGSREKSFRRSSDYRFDRSDKRKNNLNALRRK